MKNILFICESYYHKASPNGICIKSDADYLVKNGDKVTVVTLYNDKNQPEYENINGVNVYRVNAGIIETALYNNKEKDTKKKIKKYNNALKLSRINGLIHAFKYPLLSKKQVNGLYKKAKELYLTEKFDYCVCAYHKIADVLAGIKLKKNFKDIKLVLYTLDAISGGWVPNILHSKKIPMNSLKRWEKYFFNHVDKVFAMESHRGYYNKEEYNKYLDKIEFLDIPLLNVDKELESKKGKISRWVFTGSMSEVTANPKYLLKIIDKIPNVELKIYGNIEESIKKDIEKSSCFNKNIFLMGAVSHDKVIEIQKNADVLLNFGNSNPNMIPCKIFEYMSTGKKIISFTYSKTDSSLPYMKKYPNSIIVEENESKNKENVDKITEFINKDGEKISPEFIEKALEKNTPKYFRKILGK